MNQQDREITPHPGYIPFQPIVWPVDSHVRNQVQQTKISAKPQTAFVSPTTQPNQSSVQPRTTPAHVSKVRIIGRRAIGGQKTITVQFNHPSGDPYFQGASVYLRRSGQQHVLVAAGAKSPLSFTVPVSSAPHSVFVVSEGNWGSNDVPTSPSHPVRLI